MKTNSLLTYLLYALLVALIAVLGYKACQMKQDKADKVREEAELQKTLRDMGYATDTTATGSSYSSTNDSSAYYTSPTPDANGVEDAPSTTAKNNTATTRPTTTPKSTTTRPANQSTASTAQPTETTTKSAPELTSKGNVSKVKGPGQGKYTVRAGTFASKENARTRLEEVIKLRYATAEVKQLANGKWAVVILRTDNRNEAVRLADQLTAKGIDAAVF